MKTNAMCNYETSQTKEPQDRIITSKKTGTHAKKKTLKLPLFRPRSELGVFPNKVRHAYLPDLDVRQTVTEPPPTRITATRKGQN